MGRREAYELVAAAASSGKPLAEGLEIDASNLDPASYLGSADEFVDRALAFYRRELG
jgi:adenylosuccinate lyase